MTARRSNRVGRCRLGGALLSVLVAAGCAAGPQGEYQAGVYRHRNPSYSFQVPSDWRVATPDDYPSYAYAERALARLNEAGKREFREKQLAALRAFDAVLISSRGAAILVRSVPNREQVRLPPISLLSEREKQAIKDGVVRSVKDYRVESAELVDYGPNPAVRLQALFETVPATVVAVLGTRHFTALIHIGTPSDDREGFAGFEELVRSFRFE